MAENFLGPYYAEIKYRVDGHSHKLGLNIDIDGSPAPGTPLYELNFVCKDGTLIAGNLAIDGLIEVLRPYYTSVGVFESVRIDSVVPGTNTRVFLTADTLGAIGTASGSYTKAHQLTLTFITAEGGSMRVTLLETFASALTIVPQSTYPTGIAFNLTEFFVKDDAWVLAKDTSYPVAKRSYAGCMNNALERKRYRS